MPHYQFLTVLYSVFGVGQFFAVLDDFSAVLRFLKYFHLSIDIKNMQTKTYFYMKQFVHQDYVLKQRENETNENSYLFLSFKTELYNPLPQPPAIQKFQELP